MSSSRLPGKVLADVVGQPMIIRQIERIERSGLVDQVVVLTSRDSSDDELYTLLKGRGVEAFRGDLNDVLARFQAALREYPCKTALRLTADCPLIDPGVIDQTILSHLASGADYTSNSLVRRFPRGLDCEVFDPATLFNLERFDLSRDEREHVTLGIYNRSSVFELNSFENSIDESRRRWTVDYPKDLKFVRLVYSALYKNNPTFVSEDIRNLLRKNPQLENFENV